MVYEIKNNENELTEKQKAFCKEYIWDYNGARAARAVGYSEKTAKEIASENLTKPNIKAYIEYLKSNLEETVGISKQMVLTEHKKLAFSSIAHLHLTWITRKEFEDLTEEQKASIEEISTKTRTEWEYDPENPKEKKPVEVEYIKVKLYNKQKSLDAINTMMGWNSPEKVEVTNPDGSLNQLPPVVLTIPDHIIENLKQKG